VERLLITGVQGCLGAWAARAALDLGHAVVGLDLGDNLDRLRLVLGDALQHVELISGDVTDLPGLERVLDTHTITRVLHLAALQVPGCRENPPLGALVNVVGTVNIFEAVKRASARIPGLAYASSAAVYGLDDPSPASESRIPTPATHYGVYKLANEGTARIAWGESRVASIGVRPYVVYGPGRDLGLTSGPSLAMAAAARGEPYRIGYSSRCQYDYAPDVGAAVVAAALSAGEGEGAIVGNFPGVSATTAEVVAAIEAAAPDAAGLITWDEVTLPFPSELEAVTLDGILGPLPRTPLAEGVAATVATFRRC
jgi:nucleoside-diphosphate-sugar epimerase